MAEPLSAAVDDIESLCFNDGTGMDLSPGGLYSPASPAGLLPVGTPAATTPSLIGEAPASPTHLNSAPDPPTALTPPAAHANPLQPDNLEAGEGVASAAALAPEQAIQLQLFGSLDDDLPCAPDGDKAPSDGEIDAILAAISSSNAASSSSSSSSSSGPFRCVTPNKRVVRTAHHITF